LRPDNSETASLKKLITTPLRSNVSVDQGYWYSADEIEIYRTEIAGEYFSTPLTSWLVDAKYEYLTADKGTEYNNIDGSKSSDISNVKVGAKHRFSPQLEASAQVGWAWYDGSDDQAIYDINVNFNPTDQLAIILNQRHGIYDISPATVSRGIKENLTQLNIDWEFQLQRHIDTYLMYAHLSDETDVWRAVITPRTSVLRNQLINLDLGAQVTVGGFSQDLDNGYYAPKTLQQYYALATAYIKQSDRVSYSIFAAAGIQKDSEASSFGLGSDLAVSGLFEMSRDWLLVVSGGWGYTKDTNNFSDYNQVFANVSLERLF
jgi:hypothetical protein